MDRVSAGNLKELEQKKFSWASKLKVGDRSSKLYFLIGPSLKLAFGFILLIFSYSFIHRLLTSTSTKWLQLLSLVKYHKLFEPKGFVSLVYIYDEVKLKGLQTYCS